MKYLVSIALMTLATIPITLTSAFAYHKTIGRGNDLVSPSGRTQIIGYKNFCKNGSRMYYRTQINGNRVAGLIWQPIAYVYDNCQSFEAGKPFNAYFEDMEAYDSSHNRCQGRVQFIPLSNGRIKTKWMVDGTSTSNGGNYCSITGRTIMVDRLVPVTLEAHD